MDHNETLLKTGFEIKFYNIKEVNFNNFLLMLDGLTSEFNEYINNHSLFKNKEERPYLQIVKIKKGSIAAEILVNLGILCVSLRTVAETVNIFFDTFLKAKEIFNSQDYDELTSKQKENIEKFIEGLIKDPGSKVEIHSGNKKFPNIEIDSETARQLITKSDMIRKRIHQRRMDEDFNQALGITKELYDGHSLISKEVVEAVVLKNSFSENIPWQLELLGSDRIINVLIIDKFFWHKIERGLIVVAEGDVLRVRLNVGFSKKDKYFSPEIIVEKVLEIENISRMEL